MVPCFVMSVLLAGLTAKAVAEPLSFNEALAIAERSTPTIKASAAQEDAARVEVAKGRVALAEAQTQSMRQSVLRETAVAWIGRDTVEQERAYIERCQATPPTGA